MNLRKIALPHPHLAAARLLLFCVVSIAALWSIRAMSDRPPEPHSRIYIVQDNSMVDRADLMRFLHRPETFAPAPESGQVDRHATERVGARPGPGAGS